MPSAALLTWRSERARRLDRLQFAHATVGGTGPGRRYLTEELNHALILRLAAEFQGFARDLHDEAAARLAATLSARVAERERALLSLLTTTRRLDRGNANPSVLMHDFGLFGLELWAELQQRFPVRAGRWRQRLALLNDARNGLAHADSRRIELVAAAGWPLTLASARRWRRSLDALAAGMDRATGEHLGRVFGARTW